MIKVSKNSKYVVLVFFIFFIVLLIVIYRQKTDLTLPTTEVQTVEKLEKEVPKINIVRATQSTSTDIKKFETNIYSNDVSIENQIRETLKPEILPDLAFYDVITLNIPAYKQEYKNSCESSALRMVLSYYDITATDMEVLQRIGYSPRSRDWVENIWDDPYEMFVGWVDKPSGYGAFAPALAKAARAYGREAENHSLVSAQFIANQIYEGYPVIVWGFFETPNYVKYSWKTENGKEIEAYSGEHARVITGVVGNENAPTGFFLNDPLTGTKNEYWSSNRLMKHMNIWGSLTNQIVVIK